MLDTGERGGYFAPVNAENVRDGKPSGVTTSLGFERVVGVEARRSPKLPPTHDLEMDGASVVPDPCCVCAGDAHRGTGADLAGEVGRVRTAESPGKTRLSGHPSQDPTDAFCEHFFRCFFCRVGDRLVNDYFCRDGRDLMVAMLDDRYERWSHAE